MGFKFTFEVDVEANPHAVGEALRSRFFDEKETTSKWLNEPIREVGCYTTFDWHPDVVSLPDFIVPLDSDPEAFYDHEKEVWTRGELTLAGGRVECRYYWDGDGTLAFGFPDGQWLVNDDCKKDYTWRLYESWESFRTSYEI